jgi:hypothetical protein
MAIVKIKMEWGTPEPKNKLSNQFIIVLIKIGCKVMDFLAHEQTNAQLSQKCQPYLSILFSPFALSPLASRLIASSPHRLIPSSPHPLILSNYTFLQKNVT